jgi:hypothetical protein
VARIRPHLPLIRSAAAATDITRCEAPRGLTAALRSAIPVLGGKRLCAGIKLMTAIDPERPNGLYDRGMPIAEVGEIDRTFS